MTDLRFPLEPDGFQAFDGICAKQVAAPELALKLHPQGQLARLQASTAAPIKAQPVESLLSNCVLVLQQTWSARPLHAGVCMQD